jgi:Rrf2 family protein
MSEPEKKRLQLTEMADMLGVPRHFLGKVMNRLVKEGVLDSVKGHYGGFSINASTSTTNLLQLAALTGEMNEFDCVLRFRACNRSNPCPLHHQIEPLKDEWKNMLENTTIEMLLQKNDPGFIRSLSIK